MDPQGGDSLDLRWGGGGFLRPSVPVFLEFVESNIGAAVGWGIYTIGRVL